MKRILVVDDEPFIVGLLQKNLESHGYRVVTAANGAAALAIIREDRPDLLISDVTMPAMDGYELMAEIRRDRDLMDLPLILIVDKVPESAVINGYTTGADIYLKKPIDMAELLRFVRQLLGKSGSGGGNPPPDAAALPSVPDAPDVPVKKATRWWEA